MLPVQGQLISTRLLLNKLLGKKIGRYTFLLSVGECVSRIETKILLCICTEIT